MISSIYVTGFRDTNLSKDEFAKLDEHKAKYNGIYKLIDSRDNDFKDIFETFKGEGKNIVLYAETNKADETTKNNVINAAKELKSTFPNVNIEVNDEQTKLL
jgi:hypothetical protein